MNTEPLNPENKIPPANPSPPPLLKDMSWGAVFESLLKSPRSLAARLAEEKPAMELTAKLAVLALGGALVFGLTLGAFAMHEQLWAAPLKVLLGFALAAVICLPSLYIFTSLTGSSLKFASIVGGLVACLALLGAILLGFAPVLWVFSQSTDSFGFMGALVLAAWLIALLFGSGFLMKLLDTRTHSSKAPLRLWVGIFLLVTLQMSTSLRPLIGRDERLFTNEKKFFLVHWTETMSEMLVDTPSGE